METSVKQIVSLSGGKDSTAMLLLTLEKGEKIDDIVFFDWGKEFPEMYEHLQKLEDFIGRKITRLYPPHPFEYYMMEYEKTKGKYKGEKGYGWPTRIIRWCTSIKRAAIRNHCRGAVECIGYVYEERFRRPRYLDNQRYPLLEWGVTSEEAKRFCESHGFDWDGLYKLFDRVSCWCCPFRTKGEAQALATFFPELLEKMREWNQLIPFPLPPRYPLSKYLNSS